MSKMWLFYEWGFLRYPRLFLAIRHFLDRLRHPFTIICYEEYPGELLELTKKVWKKKLGREIPESEAIEIIRSFRNLLELLKEVKRNGKQ